MAFLENMNFTKMGADSSAKNNQKSFGPICLPKLKSLGFSKKKLPLLGVRSASLGSLSDRTFPKIAENSCKT